MIISELIIIIYKNKSFKIETENVVKIIDHEQSIILI